MKNEPLKRLCGRLVRLTWLAWLTLLGSFAAALLCACDYGQLGGADKTATYRPGDTHFERALSGYRGIWYSHYAAIGRLDGYRIGLWDDFAEWGKDCAAALFPAVDFEGTIHTYTGASVTAGDYLLLYDDTVFGQRDDGSGGSGAWELSTRYLGVVRALNVFNGDVKRGAIIIEYVRGCAPQWDNDIKDGQLPFFGVYYRELGPDTVQMANAVNLAALYAGRKYYTEKATLAGAVAENNVENEAEFISWGVVIPQDREGGRR